MVAVGGAVETGEGAFDGGGEAGARGGLGVGGAGGGLFGAGGFGGFGAVGDGGGEPATEEGAWWGELVNCGVVATSCAYDRWMKLLRVCDTERGRVGELTHDGKTGGDDADAWFDTGPYEDLCEAVGFVGMSRVNQFDDADYGNGADAWGWRSLSARLLQSRKLSINVGVI